jgi:flagellar basal-body rod protein FlgB
MEISKAHNLMKSALNYRATRQKLISGNIANNDTPFYRPKDISFESALSHQAKKIFNEPDSINNKLELANTSGNHLQPENEFDRERGTLFFRDGHLARNDGNSVDLDVETTEMSKNSTMFKALISAVKKDSTIFKSVISASEKLN